MHSFADAEGGPSVSIVTGGLTLVRGVADEPRRAGTVNVQLRDVHLL
jgi:hypothetical protein